MKAAGITAVWLPPPSASVSTEVCDLPLRRIREAAIDLTTILVAVLACQHLSIDEDKQPRGCLGNTHLVCI